MEGRKQRSKKSSSSLPTSVVPARIYDGQKKGECQWCVLFVWRDGAETDERQASRERDEAHTVTVERPLSVSALRRSRWTSPLTVSPSPSKNSGACFGSAALLLTLKE